MNKESFVIAIVDRIERDKENIKAEYLKNQKEMGIGFVSVDNLLSEEMAQSFYPLFSEENDAWREMQSYREKKLTSKQFNQFDKTLEDITFAIQDTRVIDKITEVTNMKGLSADNTLYAGGLSMMRHGDFLNPHIDNSHDQDRKVYRRLNLLYYVTPEWKEEFGGNLELWDKKVKKPVTIESRFNRLVIMETNPWSWHSVSQVVPEQVKRCCVSNYYFSKESPTGGQYYHVTSFMGRPNQTLRRMVCRCDNLLRMTIRKIKKDGLGRKDQYIKSTEN
ncbi:2OG-Fe(II) oxygenase [Halobacteriovorax sp. GB3]|uniref:2OG-Fe(II) oxygenase n=1 Tax=Halobacteriovorax sp. GB3 TaxID=2719615 RepID=UPI0023614920|nr:2OG-Fe(II) oxygenase [Halobacteriovorax sp. GB3]MDD0852542.1 2OG-Fe(II) oxygenase [Halobacteriovorax sp. GB3]